MLTERGEKEKKVEKVGINPAAAAPSQLDRLDVNRSDHLVGSKESASWQVQTDHINGDGKREKEGKYAKKKDQPGRTGAREERQLKSVKTEVISHVKKNSDVEIKRRRGGGGHGIDPVAAVPSQPNCLDVCCSDHSAG